MSSQALQDGYFPDFLRRSLIGNGCARCNAAGNVTADLQTIIGLRNITWPKFLPKVMVSEGTWINLKNQGKKNKLFVRKKMSNNSNTLHHHLTEVKQGNRRFENAFQSVSRMLLESNIEKVVSTVKPPTILVSSVRDPSISSACMTRSTALSPM